MLRERECWSNDNVISLSRWLKEKNNFLHTQKEKMLQHKLIKKSSSLQYFTIHLQLYFLKSHYVNS